MASATEETLSLESYGLRDCRIPISLKNIDQHLPTWRSLRVLRPPERVGVRSLQFPSEPLPGSIYPALHLVSRLDEGTYGTIWKAQRALYTSVHSKDGKQLLERTEEFVDIVSKLTPIELSAKERSDPKEHQERYYAEEIKAILHEVTLHILVFDTMVRRGFPTSIPRLFDVFANARREDVSKASHIQQVAIQMELVEGATLHTYLSQHFLPSSKQSVKSANSMLLIDVLIQLCIYLDILQTSLFFNHRDLKTNNVLLRKQSDTWSRTIHHPALRTKWVATHDVVLIDFGFSCLAYGADSPKTIMQAGCWFLPTHDCLKPGRDLALFLYCLQSCFPLENRISASLWNVLEGAMQSVGDHPISLLTQGVDNDGRPVTNGSFEFGEGIYRFLRKQGVDVPGCAPGQLLQTLDAYLHGA
jgi:serine/threonine protein kinase